MQTNNTIKTILKQWLLHFFIIWSAVNVYDSFHFVITRTSGHAFTNPDGSAITILQRLVEHNFLKTDMLYLAAFTLLAEFNYQYVFKRYKWIVFIISSIFIVMAMMLLFITTSGKRGGMEPVIILLGYTIAYALVCEFFHHRLHLLNVRLKKYENELQVLKQQLNPHFLFNTLNYLYGTALKENASHTAEGIEIMSGMMRYTVTGMQETFVPLAGEIQFIEQYLYLQKVRLSLNNGQRVEVSIETANQTLFIAPMLLIPFIENAFKYGISTDDSAEIKINIRVIDNHLNMTVSNTIVTRQNNIKGTNSGLELTRKRLCLLYPKKYKLEIIPGEKEYVVELKIELK